MPRRDGSNSDPSSQDRLGQVVLDALVDLGHQLQRSPVQLRRQGAGRVPFKFIPDDAPYQRFVCGLRDLPECSDGFEVVVLPAEDNLRRHGVTEKLVGLGHRGPEQLRGLDGPAPVGARSLGDEDAADALARTGHLCGRDKKGLNSSAWRRQAFRRPFLATSGASAKRGVRGAWGTSGTHSQVSTRSSTTSRPPSEMPPRSARSSQISRAGCSGCWFVCLLSVAARFQRASRAGPRSAGAAGRTGRAAARSPVRPHPR